MHPCNNLPAYAVGTTQEDNMRNLNDRHLSSRLLSMAMASRLSTLYIDRIEAGDFAGAERLYRRVCEWADRREDERVEADQGQYATPNYWRDDALCAAVSEARDRDTRARHVRRTLLDMRRAHVATYGACQGVVAELWESHSRRPSVIGGAA